MISFSIMDMSINQLINKENNEELETQLILFFHKIATEYVHSRENSFPQHNQYSEP